MTFVLSRNIYTGLHIQYVTMSPISSNALFLNIYVLNYLFIKAIFFSDNPLSFSDMLFSYVLFCSYMSIVESLPTYGVHYYAVKVCATKEGHLLN